jgi:hypothetical protein
MVRVVCSRPESWTADCTRRALRRIGPRPRVKDRGMAGEDWTFCRAEDFPVSSSHIYHSVSSGRCNETPKSETWECRVQRCNRLQTRDLHTDAKLNSYGALFMGCSIECQGSQKWYQVVKHETVTGTR